MVRRWVIVTGLGIFGISLVLFIHHELSTTVAAASVRSANAAVAQTKAMTPADIIDGSKAPNLIPDSTAYRLWFIAVGAVASPTPQQKTRQEAYIRSAGLRGADIPTCTGILAQFTSRYAALLAKYNSSPEVQSASNSGLASFLAKRDALVQATRDALKAALTPAGITTLGKAIQAEKARMKVAKEIQ